MLGMARAVIGWGLALLAGAGSVLAAAPRHAPPSSYDAIIEHGRVVDGTRASWCAEDVAICAGRRIANGAG
jgi:hypothetical protein